MRIRIPESIKRPWVWFSGQKSVWRAAHILKRHYRQAESEAILDSILKAPIEALAQACVHTYTSILDDARKGVLYERVTFDGCDFAQGAGDDKGILIINYVYEGDDQQVAFWLEFIESPTHLRAIVDGLKKPPKWT